MLLRPYDAGSGFDSRSDQRVPRVHYRLTDLGLSLEAVPATVRNWAEERMEIPSPNDAPGFRAAVRNPDNPRGFRPTSR
ncbi:winged helix-turn-helix transcriptional regulator [Actinoallomurus spadix]|uniref:HTH hxlR-type domain-containing protein n=1 Tax=Actinoallomurus spadix TaxID=79912 RepID=A0ABN0XJF9_9ACTN|nr:winged helix-turn-helix transcriptional regulator [Actinoallomurus spadix]MCO5984918.1 winged helix-turn-helix transcriptional regulator [Actinoallomurus spadix]